jgi:MFS transporter, DHA1 family, inner membrane transport protein
MIRTGAPRTPERQHERDRRVRPLLFLVMFSTQASLIALTPTLQQVAADFGVSAAVVGQLRAITGLVAGIVSLALGPMSRGRSLQSLLATGLGLLAAGSLLAAAAPTFAVLAASQVVIGGGVALVLACAVAASAEWSSPSARAKTLSLALLGQPMAWVAGLPLIGAVADHGWRVGWILVPFASSVIGLMALHRGADHGQSGGITGSWRTMVVRRDVRRWAIGELLAFAAWSGALVYAGALFVDSYGLSPSATGALLGLCAIAYFPGNTLSRRWIDAGAQPPLRTLAIVASVSVAAFGGVRVGSWTSAVLFAALVAVGGARTFAASAAGLALAPDQRLDVMALRGAATQFGYLLGASIGGLALAVFGYTGLALVLAVLFVAAAVAHSTASPRERARDPRSERVFATVPRRPVRTAATLTELS